ncbi:sensor histidine kinase [Actinomadura sp. NTSP31]|uniref:sensor histidine kinase n=1 Tax=Actinomadura sp. NTSP31 TaxID=1735447 RepID=UPI0035BFAB62
MTRWWNRPAVRGWLPGPADALAGVAAAGVAVVVLAQPRGAEYHSLDPLSWLLTGLGGAALAWGRRAPMAAVVVTSGCGIVLGFREDPVDVLPFVLTLLLFSAGYYRTGRPAAAALAIGIAGITATALARPPGLGMAALVQGWVIFSAGWAMGRLLRSRRRALLALVDAAERQAAAERDRAALTLVEERLRIARELHDVLTHSVSVISVQATVGEHLSARDPAAGRTALTTIGEVSRSTLRELRQILALLRDDSGPADAAGGDALEEPARSLADLDDLIETFRTAGLPVRATTRGAPRSLSSSAELCAYRIIQEALTNTLKHAAAGSAHAVLDYGTSALSLTITDDGRGAAAVIGAGHGIIGMRERTALLGGTLEVGPAGAGGFRVRAHIPYEAA